MLILALKMRMAWGVHTRRRAHMHKAVVSAHVVFIWVMTVLAGVGDKVWCFTTAKRTHMACQKAEAASVAVGEDQPGPTQRGRLWVQ